MANAEAEFKQNTFTRIKNFITVEPIILALAIPFYLQTISLQNLALEQSCRVNLRLRATVCDNMIDKSTNGIHCGNLNVMVEQLNKTANEFDQDEDDAPLTFYNVSGAHYSSIPQEACRAEIESQKLISTISGYMAPIESVIGIVVILFGGYWSDGTGQRKPLILFPMIGAFLELVVFLISATFMTVLPVEFSAILVSIIEAISGGENLLWMGIACYVTEITPEKDRVFRFGLLYQLYPLTAICTLPFSGFLYKTLGYIRLVLVSLFIQACGILYLVLFLKEPRKAIDDNPQIVEKYSKNRVDSELELNQSTEIAESPSDDQLESGQTTTLRHKVIEAVSNVSSVLMRGRTGMRRTIVWLLLLSNFLSVGCEYELVNEYFFVRTKLNWEALEESPFAAYGSTTAFLGNILMTTVFSKYFHFPDVVIGLISSTFSSVAKLIYIAVSTTFMLYAGRTFDMFEASSNVASRCILSMIVNPDEIGRIFSLMALLDNLSQLTFTITYTTVYTRTVDTFPNAYFIVSLGAMATVAAIFGDIRGIQETFSQTFLIQIATSGICICSVTYLMASENLTNNYNNFVMYVSLMGIYNYEISLLMFYGNEVTLASEELMGAVYHSNWMDLSIKYRKLALIFMERLKKPQEMLIGKVFPLNLKSLSSILNVAYSFFNVLRSNEQGKSPYKKSD